MNLRQCEIVTDVDKLNVDLQATFMKYATIKKWAYIIHDKDDTRPHYHICLHFGGASVDIQQVAKWFNLGYKDEQGNEHDGTQFINKIKGRWTDVLLYLTHGNESQKNKHQYSTSEVKANFDFETEIESAKILGDFEHYSYAQQLQYVNSLPTTEKVKAFSQLRKLWELQCQVLTLTTDRNIQVVFITGKGGAGKTYYAKKLLTGLNYDFCVSSASNDPFQDYLGQKGIILDDMRDYAFAFEDLLKTLDNNTSSSVKSRFANKVFNGEMIVITSSVPLVHWYKNKDDKGNYYNLDADDLIQLYRRISCYVVVTKQDISVYNDGVDELGKPKGKATMFKNELVDMKAEQRVKPDFLGMFGKICETADNASFEQMPLVPADGDDLPF